MSGQPNSLELGVVVSVGEHPLIRSESTGELVRFAYRDVKRASMQPRHTFRVGDRVKFSRLPPLAANGGNSDNGSSSGVPSLTSEPQIPIKAKQVRVLSSRRPVWRPPQPQPLQAIPVAVQREGYDVWRHDPYSTAECKTAVNLPSALPAPAPF
eukprot:TRINITY_DN68408_c0_g1_i1.p1 TRINITY_DN68408_c0_g1~~TRINITY_DN68408_c0_g1_i1.p1  ORF type:complete len:154 (+),score=3.19 TRINITY_DN68408_c0_g1_i1:91-552(+)